MTTAYDDFLKSAGIPTSVITGAAGAAVGAGTAQTLGDKKYKYRALGGAIAGGVAGAIAPHLKPDHIIEGLEHVVDHVIF
jgi:outer membrane lipoprotein SlyB